MPALAGTNPDVAPRLPLIVDRLRHEHGAFMHGDYSPKNLLVQRRDGASRPRVVVLDWEVAGAGDAVFDLAFLLTHIVAKSVHLRHAGDEFLELARAVMDEYGPVDEAWLTDLLGALLLARVDGLSKLAYLSEPSRARLRRLGVALLLKDSDLPWRQ